MWVRLETCKQFMHNWPCIHTMAEVEVWSVVPHCITVEFTNATPWQGKVQTVLYSSSAYFGKPPMANVHRIVLPIVLIPPSSIEAVFAVHHRRSRHEA